MQIKSNSLTLKISLAYIFLAIINTTFFSVMIYENQMDLIKKDIFFQSSRKTNELLSTLRKTSAEVDSKLFAIKNKNDMLREINYHIEQVIKEYAVFAEDGQILYKSADWLDIKNEDIAAGIKAISNKEFTGRDLYSKINEEKKEISFYVPMEFPYIKNAILLFVFKMSQIGDSLNSLYRMITLLIIIIIFVHVIFAFILYRILLSPVKKLQREASSISEGNYEARVLIKQDDEIGELGKAFNKMADSIQEKITVLQRRDEIMTFELDMASEIQRIIYPKMEDGRFSTAVFHRALGKVSGDYHDIFHFDSNKYGFLIADVAGHGVPAALVTMIAKDKFKLYSSKYQDPAVLFKNINSEICELLEEYSTYFTAFYMTIDNLNNMVFANAGHPKPLIFRKGEQKQIVLDTNGCPIGMSQTMNSTYEAKSIQLQKGDKVVLFTDGITEAMNENRELFNIDRITDIIAQNAERQPSEIITAVLQAIKEFVRDIETLKDDATLFIIEIK